MMSRRKADERERSGSILESGHVLSAETNELSGIIRMTIPQTTLLPTSKSSAENVTCEKTDASQKSPLILPPGIKPYYLEDNIAIICGDCREVVPQLNLEAVCITDPPYGIGRAYGDSYDDSPEGYWKWFVPCLDMLRSKFPLLAHTHRSIHAVAYLTGWDWIAVWHKPYSAGARIGNSPILPHWEPIFLYGIYKMGCDRESFPDVISVNPEPSPARVTNGTTCERQSPRSKAAAETNGHHPLPKPEALMKFLVSRLSREEQAICDPFMGSGTTLRAAKDLGRRAIGIEIEEKYAEIAARRLSQKVLNFEPSNH